MLQRLTGLAALLLLTALPARAQSVDFTRYVSIGDSLAAGFASGSLVETHQVNSVPAHLARQGGAPDFQQPLITEPGIPAELTLVSISPLVIAPKSASTGAPKNLTLARPYNNLAVPGATSVDALNKASGDVMTNLILRGLGTQVQQAAALKPTFITVWIGNNDTLGAVVSGRAIDGVTLTPTDVFRLTYAGIIANLKATGARMVAANLGDPTDIPFVTTIPPYVVNPSTGEPVVVAGRNVPLLGPNGGPLSSGSYVTLAAASLLAKGIGIPAALGGTGVGLPDEVVLDPLEIAVIRDHVNVNNKSIADICGAAGVPVVDLHSLLDQARDQGIRVGGIDLTPAFLSGGLFSYDGIHLTDIGYAVTANEFIKVINDNGGNLEPVDVRPYLGTRQGEAVRLQSAGAARGPAGPVEFTREAWEQLLAVFPPLDRR